MMFERVDCPRCLKPVFEAGPGYLGLSRHKCHGCRSRVWVAGGSEGIRIVQVDAPLKKLAQSA
jgi:transposase-like protein